MKTKKIFIVSLIILIIVTVGLGILLYIAKGKDSLSSNENPNIQYNKNPEIIKDRETNGLTFTNIECSYDGELSTISYIITNTTNETIHLGEYEILIKNAKGEVMTNINPNYDYDLPAGEEFPTSNTVNIDLTGATSMELNLDNMNQQNSPSS